MPMKNRAEGMAVSANIQRQPVWPYQEFWMNSSVDPAGRLRTRYQLMYCASRMPTTRVSWFMDTSLPRIWAGAISAMYMGDRLEARPMATPPRIRHVTKMKKVGATAFPREVTANSRAEAINNFFRPNRSLRAPAKREPKRQPMRAQLLAQPDWAASVRWK